MNKAQLIQQNQQRYNEAFDNWIQNGCVEGDSDWNTMFLIIAEVCSNKAKAMLKAKVFIDDVEEKALDAAIHIMKYQVLLKKKPIKALGAFVKGPLMNELWGVKTRKAENVDSLERIQDEVKMEPIFDPEKENEAPLFLVEGFGFIGEDQMRDSTFVFELEWFSQLREAEDKAKKFIKTNTKPCGK